ncbi:hypothetical protein Tco_0418996 [Tanacetum coccineum]
MTPTQALKAIQIMADHSQKWHDEMSSRYVSNNSNTDGLAAIVSKLDNLGRDIKKLKKMFMRSKLDVKSAKDLTLIKNVLSARKSNKWKRSETQIEQLSKEIQSRTTNGAPSSSIRQCKVVNADHETPNIPISSSASVNVMPRNTFEYLRLANMRNTNMLVEMADMTKKASLGMPFLATIHAEIDVFDKEISLGIDNARASYDMEKKDHNFTTPTEKFFMIKSDLENRPQSPACSNNQSRNLPYRSPDDSLDNQGGIVKNPLSKGFYDYKWVFDLEIDQLADEYELGIGKKEHMLDKIWEYYKDVHRDCTYWWHDHGFEEDECDEMGIEIEKYDPLEVQVETFKVKKYSFKGGQMFFCVTKEVDDVLPLGRKNRSRFREMIRKEFDIDAHNKTFQQLGEAKLKGVSCSNSTLPVYFILLMYNRDIIQNKWEDGSRIIT